MQSTKKDIAKIVIEALHELGEDLEIDTLKAADENTRLFGAKGALDSMHLVGFVADVEERIFEELNSEVVLASQNAMSRTLSPFRKVSSCIDYILELIAGETS